MKAYIMKDDKLLVIYKTEKEAANTPTPGNRRDVPGGRVEFGEMPVEALSREILEEVGLSVDILCPLRTWSFVKGDFQLVGINYLCKWKSGRVCLSREHEHYEWCGKKDILNQNWLFSDQYIEAFEIYGNYYKLKGTKQALQ